MLTISPALSAGHAAQYFREEFANARSSYWTEQAQVKGEWRGQLAADLGLTGAVRLQDFEQLANGVDPRSGVQLIAHQTPRETASGHLSKGHRAGFDFTFSAPKEISLTALVGGDERVREAHIQSVNVALQELERHVHARLGGNLAPEPTANWAVAVFQHDSSRPVDGVVGPQLHTHAVVMNATQAADRIRPLHERDLFRTKALATALYRSELAARLVDLGYDVRRGAHNEPIIAGYSEAYTRAASPRTRQIEDRLAELGLDGPVAAKLVALETRQAKLSLTHAQVASQHRVLSAQHGHQAERLAADAYERASQHERVQVPDITAAAAVTYGRDTSFEREAVTDERRLLTAALVRSMAAQTPAAIRQELEQRITRGDFVQVAREQTPSRQLTTPAMQALEQSVLDRMRDGQGSRPELADAATRRDVARAHPDLSDHQRAAVEQILSNRDQVQALQGFAGTGKTSTLAAVRQAAERSGYRVEGMAPTSRAAQQLAGAGIPSSTLQKQLADTRAPATGKRLLVLDESSLASTVQVQELLRRLQPQDRVLFVGDTKQHEAVDAGRPFAQLQDHGIATTRLSEIVRQREHPELQAIVQQLARGAIRAGIGALDAGGHVHEVSNREERHQAVAAKYLEHPTGTLVVSPDNESRQALNRVIHTSLQEAGLVDRHEHRLTVLVPRQELTGADRGWAERYERGDVVRWSRGSRAQDIAPGAYGTVERVNRHTVRVRLDTGETRTWEPARAPGVTVYRQAERTMAIGEKIQVTAPDRQRSIANRERGTVQRIDTDGTVSITMDSGRRLTLTADARKHIDHGYAVTSHSSQGLTTDRVLLHIDTSQSPALNNRRLAYVALSRGRDCADIYTDDRAKLGPALHQEVAHHSALEPTLHEHVIDTHQRPEPRQDQHQHSGHGFSH